MLSHMQVAHFRAFGYVILRGLLSGQEVEQLREEIRFAMADAYGERLAGTGANVGDVGTQHAYDLPTMTGQTPFAARLVADDPRMWQAAHYLLGAPTVPCNAEATYFLGNARWHADLEPGLTAVKFLAYLEPCSRETGQLQVLAGSHLPEAWAAFWEYIRQDPRRQGYLEDPADWPTAAIGIDTEPGDVIAFDANLLHSSVGGDRRTAWAVYYFADPILDSNRQSQIVRDAILHIGNYGDRGFDNAKWPVWREWAQTDSASDARRTAVSRLRRIGVLDVPGATDGTPDWQPALKNPALVLGSGAPPRRRRAF
jgi:hypothetical protein